MKPRARARARVRRSQVLFRGRVFHVRRDIVEEPARPRARGRWRASRRRPVVREIVVHAGSVAVLPLLGDGRILLVRQYRHAAGKFLWELVAGHIESGEKPRAAARRELREETGYTARRLELLLEFYPTPGLLTEKMYLYQASGLRAGAAQPEEDEAVEVRAFRPAELRRLLRQGRVRDAKALVALLLGGAGAGGHRIANLTFLDSED
ncbi:MAG: NUDIX hydrolase [Terriglobia bacterium]